MNGAHQPPAYGLWMLVLINSAVFILFAFSFFKPNTKRDWRTFGGFWAFIVALFVVMYGFPLTVYARLARREEREVRGAFGAKWDAYAAATPAFVPHLIARRPQTPIEQGGRP